MPATATIDLIPYTNATSDSTGSTKPYADNSSDFENILNEANKAYSTEENSSKNTAVNSDNEKTQQTNDKTVENKDEKSDKTIEKNEDKNSTEKLAENKSTQKETPKNISTDKTKEETDNTDNNIKSEQPKNLKEPDTLEIKPVSEPQPKTKSNNTEEQTQNTEQTSTQDLEPTANIADTIPVENIIETVQGTSNAKVVELTNKQNTGDATTTQNEQIPIEQTKAAQEDFSVDLTNLGKNLGENVKNKSDNTKVQTQTQTQTQQTTSNVIINSQNIPSEISQTETAKPQETQPQIPAETTIPGEKVPQTPIIEVKADVIASNTNVNSPLTAKNSQNNIQDNLDKTNLTQEIVNKTNAQVTNIENPNFSNSNSSDSNSNSNNLLSRQNAHEQAVKIALENNSTIQKDTQGIDLTDNTAITIQTVFDKQNNQTIVENTTQTATLPTQEPKELSKTDILSQISNQLNTKKLQEELTTKVNIVLRPENLGKINLELINSKEGLTAQITADNQQVKELLSKSLDNLKDSLSNQGVNVHSVTVKVEETQKQSNDMFSFNNGQQKEGNQEFSNNAQKQNQNEFSSNERSNNTMSSEEETEIDVSIETNSEMNPKIENTVSIGSSSGKVDYKV